MPMFSSQDLADWTRGQWTLEPEVPVTGIGHDTRTLKEGDLYVALPGARIDGHDLIPEARKQGAGAAVCTTGKSVQGMACLEVEDPGMALRNMATGHRRRCAGRMIGITGSAGKTTAKDFLSAMCRAAGPTCSTPGNWNNFVGLPLSILRMDPEDRFGVFEMGMNHAGEIAALAEILEPELACITSIGEAHLEQLGSVSAIAQEKTSLFACLPEDGVAVIDLDSNWRDLMMNRAKCRRITCSLYEDADVVGHAVDSDPERLRVEDRLRGDIWEIPLPLPGDHMRKNLLQTAILARECGVPPEEMQRGLEAYQGSPMRWEVHQIGTRKIINDAYNANPLSMRCAVGTFAEQNKGAATWVVLGEMAELGPESRALHQQLGAEVDRMDLQGVIAVGEPGGWMVSGLQKSTVVLVSDVGEAAKAVIQHVPEEAVLFLKASRSVGLEKMIPCLQEMSVV